MKTYFSFGQSHAHRIRSKTFDKDSICGVEAKDNIEARQIMFLHFGDKWSFEYSEEAIKKQLHFFPRGIIPLNYEEN